MKFAQFYQEDSLGIITNRVFTELYRHMLRNLRAADLPVTPEQVSILVHLWKQEGLTQQVLADRTGRDNPSVTRLVDNLEKRGLAQRQPDPNDRRARLIFLSPEGRRLYRPVMDVANETLAVALRGLNEKQIAQCTAVLKQILQNLGR
ncbi:MAG: MarR family transcriptional regulator [Bacteroidota bacterium]